MKKPKKMLAMALSLCLAVGTFAGGMATLTACGPDPSGQENPDNPAGTQKTLMRIGVSGDFKTKYTIGESFDPTGLIVTAYYNDSTRDTVTDYTLSKTGPLEKADKAITVTYNGKTADIAIEVRAAITYNTLITVPDNTTKAYVAEAEDINYDNCINPYEPDNPPSVENPGQNAASGGLSVGSLSVIGNKFGFIIHSEVETTASLIMTVSAANTTIYLENSIDFRFNDEKLTTKRVLEWIGDYYNWENVEFSGLKLKKGDNLFTAEVIGPSTPNFDCFYLLVNPQAQGEAKYDTFATIFSPYVSEYKIEAEDLDLSNCTNSNYPDMSEDPKPNTENNKDGGLNLSSLSLKGNTLGFNVENLTGEELTAYIVMRASANDHDMMPGELLDFTHNGTKMTSMSTLRWTDWNVCNDAIYDPVTLVPGNNEFELTVTEEVWGCPNLDYFKVVLIDTKDDVTYDTFATITDTNTKEYTVEAEELDLSQCTNSNYPELTDEQKPVRETNTDGGTNLSALSLGGNTLGFNVKNETGEPLVAHILMRASANERDMYPGDILIFTCNGIKMTSTSMLKWPGQNESGKIWNVCGDAVYDPITLQPGDNVFKLVVKSKEEGCPNIDYFKIILEGNEQGGGDDDVTYDTFATITDPNTKEYKIEAEELDVSRCTNSNYPEFTQETKPRTEPNNDGGISLKELSYPGNKIGFNVKNETEQPLTAHILMRASANEFNMVPGSILIFTHNGVEMTSTSTLPWAGTYNDCNDAIYSTVTLAPGDNVFELTVKSKEEGCPNIDYFMVILEDGEQGGDDDVTYDTFATISDPDTKEYTVEAEALDLSRCTNSNYPEMTQEPKPVKEPNTDGGTNLSALSLGGNTLGFNVKNDTEKPLTAHILMRAAANERDMIPGNILIFTHNGVAMTSTSTLGWTGTWNVCNDAIYSTIILQPGDNIFELTVKSKEEGCPNIDYFKIILEDEGEDEGAEYATFVTINDTETKEYTVEAEALDLSKCTNSNYPEYSDDTKPNTETNSNGGTSLSSLSLKGNILGFNVKNGTDQPLTAYILLRASANDHDMLPGELFDFTHNGVKMTSTSTLKWTTWNVCTNAVYNPVTLVPGDNIFELVVTQEVWGCPNIDYFKVVLVDAADVSEYATFVTINDTNTKEYTVEAEALDLSKCTNSNYPEFTQDTKPVTEDNKDGGKNLSALSLAGNTLGFNVKNETGKPLTARIILRAAANSVDMIPGEILDFTLNGVRMTSTSTLSWTGDWNVCNDAVYNTVTLAPGDNVFELVVKTREFGCPNLDCFKIELADEEGRFPSEAGAASVSVTPVEIALPDKFMA